MRFFVRLTLLMFVVGASITATGYGQVVAVSDFSNEGRSLQRSDITNFQDALYFSVGVDDTDRQELWRFDGEHVDLVHGGFHGSSETALAEFTEFQDSLYFRADLGTHGQELYRYDGREVRLVADLQPGSESSSPVGLYVHNDALYFSAQQGESFNNLWQYDGERVSKVATFENPRSSVVTGASFQGDLYFGADDGTHGMELWKYDGEQVSMVADIHAGDDSSFPRDFLQVGDTLAFKAATPDTGQEIFRFDGEDVSLWVDTNPGPKSSDTGYLTAVDDELHFSGVAWGDRFVYRTEGDRVIKIMEGGGPIDLGTGELATIRGRRQNGVEINELYLQDGSFFRSTVTSAGSFETLGDNVYFSCDCPLRELFRLAKDGDTNSDGSVDFSDFLIISRNFGNGGDWRKGDFTNDGRITFGDFLKLSQNFGKESQPAILRSGAATVPEPTTVPWVLLAVIGLRLRRARR